MKICRECKQLYPDTVNICGRDGGELLPAEALPPSRILSGVALIIASHFVEIFLLGGRGIVLPLVIAVGVAAWWAFLYLRHQRP